METKQRAREAIRTAQENFGGGFHKLGEDLQHALIAREVLNLIYAQHLSDLPIGPFQEIWAATLNLLTKEQ